MDPVPVAAPGGPETGSGPRHGEPASASVSSQSPGVAPVPDEKRELRLLDQAEFKLALASSDKALSDLLAVYLCPILLKLNSPHESVRQKVRVIADHLHVRVSTVHVKLPIAKLIKMTNIERTPGGSNNSRETNSQETKVVAAKFAFLGIQFLTDSQNSGDQWETRPDELLGLVAQALVDNNRTSGEESCFRPLWASFVHLVWAWSHTLPLTEPQLEFWTPALAEEMFDLVLQFMFYSAHQAWYGFFWLCSISQLSWHSWHSWHS